MAQRALYITALLLGCGASERPAMYASDVPLAELSAIEAPDVIAPGDAPGAPSDVRVAAVDAVNYPQGPYGAEVGDTLADLSWEGYVRHDARGLASEVPFESTSMAALRQGGRGHALIFIAEFL